MAYLIIPSRRTRQPQGAARINWAAPLSRGLAFSWYGANRHEVISGRLTTTKNAGVVAVPGGLAAACSLSQANVEWASWDAVKTSDGAGSGDFTFAVYANPSSTGAAVQHVFAQKNDATSPYAQAALLAHSSDTASLSSGGFAFFTFNNPNSSGVAAAGVCDGAWHMWTGVRSGAGLYLYKDGALVASNASPLYGVRTITQAAARYVAVGSRGNGTTEAFNQQIERAVAWNRALSADEVAEDFRWRYQTFSPDPRRLYFGTGAGGGGDTSLILSDSTQTQTTDAAILVTSSFLVVQEATQSHSSENVVLDASVSTNLIVADATQAHTSENSILQVSINLVIDDSTQSQASDNIALTSVHSLIIQECIQDQSSENVTLDSGLILTVADCIQDHTAENIIILASSLLLINDATQDQTSENLSFTLATNISINDSVHSISSESPNLTIPGSGTGATVEEIVDGIMAALLADTIPVNIKKINDVLVYGIGTDGNPWRESA